MKLLTDRIGWQLRFNFLGWTGMRIVRKSVLLITVFLTSACNFPHELNMVKELKKSKYEILTTHNHEGIVLQKKWNGNVCRARVINRGEGDVNIKEIIMFSIQHELPYSTSIYGEGFTMLSQTGGTLGSPKNLGHFTDKDHYKIPQPTDATVVYNLLKLRKPSGGYCLMAFTSSNRFVGRFYIREGQIQISIDCENLKLSKGEEWQLEDFVYLEGESQTELFKTLAEEINNNHPRLNYSNPPTGWCSLWTYCASVKGSDVDKIMSEIDSQNLDFKFIQIDEGYQNAMGDWLETREGFGGNVADYVNKIKLKGFEPAIWIAPFIVEKKSKVYSEHPEWLVKGHDGLPLCSNKVTYGGWRKGPWYVLDGTHPEVQEHLKKVFSTMKDEWGCNYFKLDANFWGAIHGGVFYDKKATRVEAYRRGMLAILEGTDESFLLGCNHPIWPSLGLIHGSRTSMDAKRSWDNFNRIAYENLLRNWMNNALWYNDPDCVVLSGDLNHNEYSFHTASVYATGGSILSGDDLSALPKERLELLKQALPPTGNPFKFEDDKMEFGILPVQNGFEMCLLNWSDKTKIYTKNLKGNYHIIDKWENEDLGFYQSTFSIKLKPHSGKILQCTETEMN